MASTCPMLRVALLALRGRESAKSGMFACKGLLSPVWAGEEHQPELADLDLVARP
jgi:hypothetical protein